MKCLASLSNLIAMSYLSERMGATALPRDHSREGEIRRGREAGLAFELGMVSSKPSFLPEMGVSAAMIINAGQRGKTFFAD